MQTASAKTLQTLFQELLDLRSRFVDVKVPYGQLTGAVRKTPGLGHDGQLVDISSFVLHGADVAFSLDDSAWSQLAQRLSEDNKLTVDTRYMKLLNEREDPAALDILRDNVNYWIKQRRDDRHASMAHKRVLFRLRAKDPMARLDPENPFSDPTPEALRDAELSARAVLSDRYLIIDNVTIAATLAQLLSDKLKLSEAEFNWAVGARVFNWRLDPKGMDILIANPKMAFNLNDPDAGVQYKDEGGFKSTGCAPKHGWLQVDQDGNFGMRGTGGISQARLGSDQPPLLVFPASRIRNSETGHGGLSVETGIYEAICNNTCFVGEGVQQRHLGGAIQLDDNASEETFRRTIQLVMAKLADNTATVFDPKPFETHCRNFLSLFQVEIQPSGVSEIVSSSLSVLGLSAELLDDIMQAYQPLRADGVHTLGDVQRAVTQAAQKPELTATAASGLEDLGGRFLEGCEWLPKEARGLIVTA